ncbi:hypothetical protein I6F48_00295 [Pseudoalteromonas sp. SWYJ118]|uniref:hypothetical protein n=1 Tax=Pseudoalteromonas sp. SWYJ118 TaxID=2792062 RepID=UPI0018CE1494|nr:hypothetical protein [Pseudoalteromonas sp. SWYJ118]MBH0074003.1 hypothetical protein [Pseudoalteromonas sp. SWYJ118]
MNELIGKTLEITDSLNIEKCFFCSSDKHSLIKKNEPESYEHIEIRTCNQCNSEWLVSHFYGEIYFAKDEELTNKRFLGECL